VKTPVSPLAAFAARSANEARRSGTCFRSRPRRSVRECGVPQDDLSVSVAVFLDKFPKKNKK
jgi:hypothetical protein